MTRQIGGPPHPPVALPDIEKPMTRSILAIVIGYLVFAVPSVALLNVGVIDPRVPPSGRVFLFSLVYGACFALLAGWVAVRLAGRPVLWPALVVAVVVALLAGVSLAFARGVYWTELSALILMAPAVVVGGAFRLRKPR